MDGPPTRMMYSESVARALPPSTSKSTSDKESRRMTPISRSTIYAGDELLQVMLWLGQSSGRDIALQCPDGAARRPYQGGSRSARRSEEHTSALQAQSNIVY